MVTHNNRINPDDINTYVIYGHGKATKAKAKSGIHSKFAEEYDAVA